MEEWCFSETVLGPFLEPDQCRPLAQLGVIRTFAPGQLLLRKGELSNRLFILLDGQAIRGVDAVDLSWTGAGGIIGELGFVRREPSSSDVIAGGLDPVVAWSISRAVVDDLLATGQYTEQLYQLFACLSAFLEARADSVHRQMGPSRFVCDYDHPSIRGVAAALTRETPFETARAIWAFVREFPYRLGVWDFAASDTLKMGYGMCTTKSNLQVALMRSAGLDASFCRVNVVGSTYALLMPRWYSARVRPTVKHYMAMVHTNNGDFVLDSSYSTPVAEHAGKLRPKEYESVCRRHECIGDYDPLGVGGVTVGDAIVRPDIEAEVAKPSRYAPDNFLAMNSKLDRIQGFRAPHSNLAALARRLIHQGHAQAGLEAFLVGLRAQAELIAPRLARHSDELEPA